MQLLKERYQMRQICVYSDIVLDFFFRQTHSSTGNEINPAQKNIYFR
uniref:Uncharacterized protein n=1 Tax=Rhizophora mucronata TaxID=61149 RepID=A0A2P2PTF2_RHIMU